MTTTVPGGSWTARICRGEPGARDLADLITARGATVRWCGPDCACGQETVQLSGIRSREVTPGYEDEPDD